MSISVQPCSGRSITVVFKHQAWSARATAQLIHYSRKTSKKSERCILDVFYATKNINQFAVNHLSSAVFSALNTKSFILILSVYTLPCLSWKSCRCVIFILKATSGWTVYVVHFSVVLNLLRKSIFHQPRQKLDLLRSQSKDVASL